MHSVFILLIAVAYKVAFVPDASPTIALLTFFHSLLNVKSSTEALLA